MIKRRCIVVDVHVVMLVNQKKNKGKETTSNLADKNTNLSQIQERDTNVDEDTIIRN
jgi:hypothetical protein